MSKFLSKFPEWKILAYLGIITLTWHLVTIFGAFLGFFADIFLLLVLSWILAFIIEPLVLYLSSRGLTRTTAAVLVYFCLAILVLALVLVAVPTTVSQLSQLANLLPSYFPQNSLLAGRLEGFLTSTVANSVTLASELASGLTALTLVFILSFYFLISRAEISRFILSLIPDQFEEDYHFLESTLNTTFASFLRVQLLLGLVLGLITFLTLWLLHLDFAISTSILSALLAMIPVVGSVLFLVPPLLAAFIVSPQKLIIVTAILIIAAQLVYNVWGPRLLGKALKIHPIVVLISFLIGYKIAGVWGAIFAVPITSSLTIILRDVWKYWQEEANSPRR